MKILSASSLFWANEKQNYPQKSRLKRNCIAIPGMSVNPHTKNRKKSIQYSLENTQTRHDDDAIWHDTINNSLSKHHSNYNRPLSPKQLVRDMKKYPEIEWIVFFPRLGAPNVFQQLCSSRIPSFNVLQYTFSNKVSADEDIKVLRVTSACRTGITNVDSLPAYALQPPKINHCRECEKKNKQA